MQIILITLTHLNSKSLNIQNRTKLFNLTFYFENDYFNIVPNIDKIIALSKNLFKTIKSKHISSHDILYHRHDGTLGRVDIFHAFHAQNCNLPKCKNFFDWYISKK